MGIGGDGGGGVEDCEAVVFYFDVGLGAVGEEDGVGGDVDGFGVGGDGLVDVAR